MQSGFGTREWQFFLSSLLLTKATSIHNARLIHVQPAPMHIRTQLSAIERVHFPNSLMSCKIISASGAKRRFAPALKASPGAKSCFAPTLKVLPGVKSVFAPARHVLPGVKSCLAPALKVSPGVKSVFAPAAKALPGAKCRLAPGAKKIQYETGAFAFPRHNCSFSRRIAAFF